MPRESNRQILAALSRPGGCLALDGPPRGGADAGRLQVAIELIGRAIGINPGVVAFHCNLGEVYRRAEIWDQAIASLRPQAIELALPAWPRPGTTTWASLSFSPAVPTRRSRLIAGRSSSRPIMRKPTTTSAMPCRPGAATRKRSSPTAAPIELQPGFAEAYGNLGNPLWNLSRLDEAVEAYRQAIALRPDLVHCHHNLGNVLKQKGRLHDAIAAYRQAMRSGPERVEAYNDLFGNALSEKGCLDEAIDVYRRAIALRPDYAAAHSNLGVALKGKGWLDGAIAAFDRAAEIHPDLPAKCTTLNLGSTLLARGDREQANRAYRRALTLRPGYVAAHSNLLTCEQYQSGVTLAALARDYADWDETHAAPYRAGWMPWDLDRDAERPLQRLGFLSPDLCGHPVGNFLVRALENLDRRLFAIVCYATGTRRDALSDRIAAAAREWHEVAGLDDDSLAGRIRDDRIDILFDLSGHTIDNRMLVFARRPAPIQITWIGYVGTTGLAAMDYLIADRAIISHPVASISMP